MAKVVFKVVKPPVVLKALPSTHSCKVPSAPNQPEDSGPELEVSELKESASSTSQPSQQVQEQISEASNTDSDKADEPTPEEEQPLRSLKVRLPLKLLKHGNKATTSSSKDGATPSKVRKESEAEEAKATALTGPSDAALRKPRDHIPLQRLLWQTVQGATAPLPAYEELLPLPHEQAGGFSMK